jgi:hypothetical protein
LILIVFFLLFTGLKGFISKSLISTTLLLYFIVSVIAYFDKESFQNLGRFSGFTPSASIYSTYITSVFILFLFFSRSMLLKITAFLLCIFLLYLTQARLNLVYLILVPFIIHFSTNKRNRKLIFIATLVGLNLVYPAYKILSKETNVAELRYEDGRDASFELRYALYSNVLQDFMEGSLPEKLLGRGAENSRLLILRNFEEDHMPHNDFIRVLNDYGIIWFLLFFILMFKLSISSKISCVLMTLYLLSFYHNMIFNLYLILLILLFCDIKNELNNS